DVLSKIGSAPNREFPRARCWRLTLTTDGSTRLSIGAGDGIGVPFTTFGNAPAAGTVVTASGDGLACAGWSSRWLSEVAAKPPKAAAAVSASRVVRARREGDACCIAVRLRGCAGVGRRSARIHTFRRRG